jgi:hypothetical protein
VGEVGICEVDLGGVLGVHVVWVRCYDLLLCICLLVFLVGGDVGRVVSIAGNMMGDKIVVGRCLVHF